MTLAAPRTQFIDQTGKPLDIEDPAFPLHWPRAADRWRYVVAAEHWVTAILGSSGGSGRIALPKWQRMQAR